MRVSFATAKRGALAATAAVALFSASVSSHAELGAKLQDAVSYQENLSHTGRIDFAGGFTAPLKQLWSVDLNAYASYPVTGEGMVFVTAGNNNSSFLYALDITTGAVIWEKLLPGTSTWAESAYDEGKVFVINGSGVLMAFRATSGKKLWSAQLSGYGYYNSSFGAPAAGNGLVVLQYLNQNYTGTIVAFDEATGSVKWTVSPGGSANVGVSGLAAISKDGIFLDDSEDALRLSPVDGSTIWSTPANCSGGDVPVLWRSMVYATRSSCSDNKILNATDGTESGSYAGSTSPVMLSNKSLLVTVGGILYAYSPKNYNVNWSFEGNGQFNLKPLVVNGVVVALSTNGTLYLIDGRSGTQLWDTTLPYGGYSGGADAGLAAGEGVLLVPNGTILYAFAPWTNR